MRESEKALNIAVFVECELPNGSKHADILFELIQKSMYPLMEAKRYVDHLLYTYSQNGHPVPECDSYPVSGWKQRV